MADDPFVWGEGGSKDTVARRRRLAEAMLKSGMDYSPVQHWTQGLARVAQSLVGGYEAGQADKLEKGNAAKDAEIASGLLSGIIGGGSPASANVAAAAPSTSTADPTAAVSAAPADLLPRFAQAEAQYGLPANYLTQTAKIESNFNPNAKNPNSSATGLLQFTAPTARQYGLTNPRDPIASIDAGARLAADNKAILTRALGREPTAGELYLAHQQGGGGASKLLSNPNARAADLVGADAVRLNGGNLNMSAGEFAKRWTSKLAANEADMPAAGAVPVEAQTGQPGFAIPGEPAAPAMTPQNFAAITGGEPPLDPVFKTEGASQPWMGTALAQPQAAPAMVAQAPAPMPLPRPADLALANPQADMPAPGAVQAMGQAPQMMPDLSNTPDGGMRQIQLAEEQARQGQQAAPQAGASPISRVAQALGIQSQPEATAAAPASPAVAQVAAAIKQSPNDPLVQALTNPAASENTRKLAMVLLTKKIESQQRPQWTEQTLPDGSLAQRNTQTGEMKIVRPGVDPLDRESKRLEVETKKKGLAKAEPPLTREIEVDGTKTTQQWNPETRIWENPRSSVAPNPDKNPYALPGKPTEDQSKSAGFANRMAQAHAILDPIEEIGVDKKQAGLNNLPFGLNNIAISKERQSYNQAKENFVTAVLRKESGAVIGVDEFNREERKYFPIPGDSPEQIAQKRQSRITAMQSMMGSAGTGYKIPAGVNFGEKKPKEAKQDGPPPPAGVDANIWKHMTPEERALWK